MERVANYFFRVFCRSAQNISKKKPLRKIFHFLNARTEVNMVTVFLEAYKFLKSVISQVPASRKKRK